MSREALGTWVLVLASLWCSGCVHPLRRDFAKRFDCPVEAVRLDGRVAAGLGVRGCQRLAMYSCPSPGCFVSAEPDEVRPARRPAASEPSHP